jgi:hypothetical protein
MPWTNIVVDCSPAFIDAVMACPLFHNIYNSIPFSFYCIRVNPDNVWVFAVFCNLSSLTTTAEFKNTFRARLLADPTVINMVKNDHSNVPGKHEPSTVLDVVLHFAQVSTCTVCCCTASGSIPITVYRLVFPPISNDPAATARLRNHIMSPGFVFEITRRGEANPWLRPNPQHPEQMACTECHGIDHYKEDYRRMHGLLNALSSSVPTSLVFAPSTVPEAPVGNDWVTVSNQRGRFHGG